MRATRMNLLLLVILLAGLLLLAGCGQQEAAMDASMAEEAQAAARGEMDTVAYDADMQVEVQEQLIIRTGELSLVVEDTEESVEAIAALAESLEGWVVSSNLYRRSDDAFSGSITVRVPVDRFGETMRAIQEQALEVERVIQESQDVTEEYVDLSARLENLEVTAARVRNFLDEAEDVEDALDVNQELSRLESEIEALKGRIQYLEQSASFSTITVNLTPDELSQPIEVGGWRPTGIIRDAVEALIGGLQFLATIAIWGVIVFLPLALLIFLPLFLLIRFVVRRRRERTPAAAAEAVEG